MGSDDRGGGVPEKGACQAPEPGLESVWSGLDAGTLAPDDVRVEALVGQQREVAADLEDATAAVVQLSRVLEAKARALLPTPVAPEAEGGEPGAEPDADDADLAERVAAYQAFAEAAALLRSYEESRALRFGRPQPESKTRRPAPSPAGAVSLEDLLTALSQVWERARPRTRDVTRERLTVGQVVARLRTRLSRLGSIEFEELFPSDADRFEVVVTFLAVLELVRLGEARAQQPHPFQALRLAWSGPEAESR